MLQSQDIRKWFVKPHEKEQSNGNASKPANPSRSNSGQGNSEPVCGGQESSGRRKASKYFATDKQKLKEAKEELPDKRKAINDCEESLKSQSSKKIPKVEDNDDDDFVLPMVKNSVGVTPGKKLKCGPGRGVTQKSVDIDEGNEDDIKNTKSFLKTSGRGCGRSGESRAPAGGRGRGGGRGKFMNFGEKKGPPHKGEKDVPEGSQNCLGGLTFVISGTLDSLEREEAEYLIKRHGGRVTGSVSKKTNYLLCDEDIGGAKSNKAKELGTPFLTEDGFFDMISASSHAKATATSESKKSVDKVHTFPPKERFQKEVMSNSMATKVDCKSTTSGTSPAKRKAQNIEHSSLMWTEKYKPKDRDEIVGNRSMVNQLHEWLACWNDKFLVAGSKRKGKKQNDHSSKKAVLLCGAPGVGKTTSAKLVSQMMGFQAIEVNASDSRGKANAKIDKGIDGSNANSIKELVTNGALSSSMDCSKDQKTVLIMDEVDGMSSGDRGGIADLIASIKISKIPIICICNDRYSQKLKSLVNYCVLLKFDKPNKQQMAKRLMQVAIAEGLQVGSEIALEELAERVNGDMRMALNQLQYMSLSESVIKYDDIRHHLLSSAKDEDISAFNAVDKLLGFNAGRLRMDERIDLSMSDIDLVPLLIQENYINYRPISSGKDEMKRANLIAKAAESISNGDIINLQIRRHQQWQLSQTSSLSSCVIPAALLHGQREIFEQGENIRFGGWLGKNSTMGKNLRLLDNLHAHILASGESNLGRRALRLEYLTLLLKQLTHPLHVMPKDEAVKKVVEFMNVYSISQENFDTIVELSKFQGHANPLEGVPPAVKAALTKAYKIGSGMVRAADLVTVPGMKGPPKKRIAAILEPYGDMSAENEEENTSDTEDPGDENNNEKLEKHLQSISLKGFEVQLDLKKAAAEKSSAKKKPAGRGKGGSASTEKKGGGHGPASATKRKR